MSPSRFQVPPRPSEASQSVNGGPPEMSIFLSLAPAKKPTNRLSGDQKGYVAPLVPVRGSARNESIARTHNADFPPEVEATKVRRRPSGESANPAASDRMKLVSAIGLM